jgi:hypothetical protein
MSPAESKTTPEPSPELVRISTTDGFTWLMTLTNAFSRADAAEDDDGGDAADTAAGDDEVAGPELVHPVSPSTAAVTAPSAAGHRQLLGNQVFMSHHP